MFLLLENYKNEWTMGSGLFWGRKMLLDTVVVIHNGTVAVCQLWAEFCGYLFHE